MGEQPIIDVKLLGHLGFIAAIGPVDKARMRIH